MSNYAISDFITRIKNASQARRHSVILPYLKINKAISKVLAKEGFLEDVKEKVQDGKKVLVARIRYEKRTPVLLDTKLVSKPSLRVYVAAKSISALERKGRHTLVLSTNQGIMTGREAYKKNIGGEVLFRIW